MESFGYVFLNINSDIAYNNLTIYNLTTIAIKLFTAGQNLQPETWTVPILEVTCIFSTIHSAFYVIR